MVSVTEQKIYGSLKAEEIVVRKVLNLLRREDKMKKGPRSGGGDGWRCEA